MSARKPRVLLIGPLPRADSPIGGTQVSFGQLVEGFRAGDVFDVEVVDTARRYTYERSLRGALSNLRSLVRVLAKIALHGPRCDLVFFNASSSGLLLGGAFVALATRLVRRPLVVRAFGGSLDEQLRAAPRWIGALTERTTLRADLLLLQTDALCRHFAGLPQVAKLPTSRPMPENMPARRPQCRRLLFLAQLRPEKGIVEALRAIEFAPEGCTLSVCGPWMPGLGLEEFSGASRARFLGEVAPRDVSALLARHDALVFPSYWPGEGLPGVVIEALQSGLPVIATRWRALPELVVHGVNGLLVEPRSVTSLAEAITLLADDDALFARLCAGARERGREYSAQIWQARLESRLLALCARQGSTASQTTATPIDEPAAPLPQRSPTEVTR